MVTNQWTGQRYNVQGLEGMLIISQETPEGEWKSLVAQESDVPVLRALVTALVCGRIVEESHD